MTREEAIDVLKANYPDVRYEQLREAVDLAVEVLSEKSYILPNSRKGRLIYEDDVIVLLDRGWKKHMYPTASNVHALPSPQIGTKTVYCSNCKHSKHCYDEDGDSYWKCDKDGSSKWMTDTCDDAESENLSLAGGNLIGDSITIDDAIKTSLDFFVEFLGGAFDEDAQNELITRFHRLSTEGMDRNDDNQVNFVKPKQCDFCKWHDLEAGDTLYINEDWDGGVGFAYIRDIQYCPKCGRKLD